MVGMMTPNRAFHEESSSTTPALDFGSDSVRIRSLSADSNFNQARTGKAGIGRSPAALPTLISEDSLGHQSEFAQNQPPIVTKQQCKALCSCVCHARSIVRSPWILEIIIGKIILQYAGRRPACNELYCRRSPESSLNVVYQLPKYIMSRYISISMQYAPLSGPEFLLRVPRMVPWSHLLWKYLNDDNLSAIQKLFAEGRASPHDLNLRGSNALIYSAKRPSSRLSRFLLEQGADPDHPNDIGETPSDHLWESSFAGNFGSEGISVVGSMLRDTSHVQTQGFSTLHKIVLGIDSQDLESELDNSTTEINVGDLKNRTPLCWATIRGDLQAVKTLLAFHADPNVVDTWGHTPLDFAKSIDICKMLLDAGVNTHTCNKDYGRSALHQLLHRRLLGSDTVEIIDLLVDAGINVDVRDSDEETPLLNAIYFGHTSHACRLIELGANVNVPNLSSRESAIQFAVLFDCHEIIPLLLERGADYTAVNARGNNIAHMAAWSASTKTISVLANSKLVKLDISLRSKDGKTPADFLSERSILTESEQGLRAEFERFIKSIPMSQANTADGISGAANVDERSDTCSSFHLPGAYPVFADPSVSF